MSLYNGVDSGIVVFKSVAISIVISLLLFITSYGDNFNFLSFQNTVIAVPVTTIVVYLVVLYKARQSAKNDGY
jgi:hypothetical protein